MNGLDLFSPSSRFSLVNNCRARYTIQLTEITLSIDSNNGAFSIIVFTPSEENASNNPVPITTPKRCGYVSLIPNLAPEIVKRIMLGPGVNKPTNTKINNGVLTSVVSRSRSQRLYWLSSEGELLFLYRSWKVCIDLQLKHAHQFCECSSLSVLTQLLVFLTER